MKTVWERNSKEVDTFILGIADEKHKAMLIQIRDFIKNLDERLTEKISWWMPCFYYMWKQLVAYNSFKKHCSFFPMSLETIAKLDKDLEMFKTSKWTLQFTSEKAIPNELIKKIVEIRKIEIENI